jgi:hypothetical protein
MECAPKVRFATDSALEQGGFFVPIHVCDTTTSRPVAVLLRPGKTPSGIEIRRHLRRLVKPIRKHWPTTRLTIRGDGHYGRPEVMDWCDENGLDFIFGLPGNAVLDRAVDETADDIRTHLANWRASPVGVIRSHCRHAPD